MHSNKQTLLQTEEGGGGGVYCIVVGYPKATATPGFHFKYIIGSIILNIFITTI